MTSLLMVYVIIKGFGGQHTVCAQTFVSLFNLTSIVNPVLTLYFKKNSDGNHQLPISTITTTSTLPQNDDKDTRQHSIRP